MEFLMEMIFELFVEGAAVVANSSKTPNIIRFVILTFLFGIMGLFYYLAYDMRVDRGAMWGFIAMGTIVGIFFVSVSVQFKRVLNSRKIQE